MCSSDLSSTASNHMCPLGCVPAILVRVRRDICVRNDALILAPTCCARTGAYSDNAADMMGRPGCDRSSCDCIRPRYGYGASSKRISRPLHLTLRHCQSVGPLKRPCDTYRTSAKQQANRQVPPKPISTDDKGTLACQGATPRPTRRFVIHPRPPRDGHARARSRYPYGKAAGQARGGNVVAEGGVCVHGCTYDAACALS